MNKQTVQVKKMNKLINKKVKAAKDLKQAMPKKLKQRNPKSKSRNDKVSAILLDRNARQFKLSLADPFNPQSLGTQVPDSFSFPTTCYHSHTETVLGCATASGYTYGAVLVVPNPIISIVDISAVNGLGASSITVTSTSMNRYNTTASLVPSCFYGATTTSDLLSKFSTWRVASWGIKLSNL
jgi:hypothetical protein